MVPKPKIHGASVAELLEHLTAPEDYTRLQAKRELAGRDVREAVISGARVAVAGVLKKSVTIDDVNSAMREAAEGELKGILSYCEDPIVSSDIIGDPHSSIFDSLSTLTMPASGGRMVKVVSWYDNEWGYSCRTADIIAKMAAF